MFEFFETLAPENEERLPDTRVDKIKASVLSRIEEDKPMKKHFTIKPLLIAAAITATGAISAISAGAVTTPAISEETLPAATVAAQSDVTDTPDTPVTPAAPENDPKPDTTSEPADSTYELIELAPPEILDGAGKGSVSVLILQKVGTELEYEALGEKISDMELISVDDDGVRHFKSSTGDTVSIRLVNSDEEDVAFYYYEF